MCGTDVNSNDFSMVPILEPVGSNLPIIKVPVALVSNEAMRVHLVGNRSDQIDWLEGSLSSPCGGEGEDLHELEEDFHEPYNLKVGRIKDIAFAQRGGKRRRGKPKKKLLFSGVVSVRACYFLSLVVSWFYGLFWDQWQLIPSIGGAKFKSFGYLAFAISTMFLDVLVDDDEGAPGFPLLARLLGNLGASICCLAVGLDVSYGWFVPGYKVASMPDAPSLAKVREGLDGVPDTGLAFGLRLPHFLRQAKGKGRAESEDLVSTQK
ncbi:hypothetical protein M5K25_019803 [Dendrobium thyrsiflorum]|uniref:Uncharacterized protein n=1 Tax=Dendrobium thyrsiflorum TaxID=117978 RepID=A0ABD0UGE4_DENTH